VLVGALSTRRSRVATDTRWFEMSNDMLVEASLDGYFTRLSVRWEQCLGWTREELMSRPFREFIHPDDLDATLPVANSLDERPDEVVNFENRYMAKDGSWRWLLWSARSDEHRKYAVAKDITDRKQLEHERQGLLDRVEAMARTDPTTGLPNRRSWEEELRAAIARAQRHGHSLAVALVDLDRFKLFNDTYGHPAGDALLADAAASWRLTLRVTDFIARYGGEEFALLFPECPPDEALAVLDRLRAATPQSQTASVGIAYWDRSESPEDLVARADAALYEAKDAGRNRVVTSG
jgi:diguanylate cyclase (GGDEF)-like protein/PAS domain S-box-containing protein